ncbi:hypothetical protein [Thalassobacillus pellis]|uniref:hypothetical protein n=1 Tax=Thalassobacillus pellis TaxID=748008 RepID=UPI0019621BBF|nr:hypothetical protein [Thalassobacillus pellis]MBM7553892.1 hypothetical protein [Thalassobacillus pellis]
MQLKHQKILVFHSLAFETNDLEIKKDTRFDNGTKIVDEKGDYILFYYHPSLKRIVYTFKDMEDTYFLCV